MAKGQIRARIQCMVDIPVGVWSGGVTDLDELTNQVRKEGQSKLQKMFGECGGWVIGSPKVVFVLLNELKSESETENRKAEL